MKTMKMKCTVCGKEMTETECWRILRYLRTGRAYCSKECAKKYMSKISSETMARTNRKYASTRMKERNPMRLAEVREKVSKTLKTLNHKPPYQGGNGKPLPLPEKILLEKLKNWGFVSQCCVKTGHYHDQYPPCYKIDVGNSLLKIGIEADGISHKSISRQIQDKKKDEFLRGLGWKILRFKNEEIMENTDRVMSIISELMTSTLTSQIK